MIVFMWLLFTYTQTKLFPLILEIVGSSELTMQYEIYEHCTGVIDIHVTFKI